MAWFLSIQLTDDNRPETLVALGQKVEFAARKLRALRDALDRCLKEE